jgi:DNA-binding NtrC family response regulator
MSNGPTAKKRPSVLLVDDEELVLSAVSRLLRRHFDVITATSVEDAIARMSVMKFDAIVTDHWLGEGGDGLELLGHVRDHAADTLRVLVTGTSDERFASERESGLIQVFLEKPFGAQDLISALQTHLS